MVAAILFDLDGTLLDTAPEFTYCINRLLEQEGKPPISLAKLRTAVSFGAQGMITRAFNITPQDPKFAALKQQFLTFYAEKLGLQTSFFPGIDSILNSLSTQKIQWGIVTNKPTIYTMGLIEKFKVLATASCVVSGDTLTTQKPDPAQLFHACKLLQVPPEQCWYVGDAKTDLQASKAAGMRCAIANYGYIPPDEDVIAWEADCYLANASEISKLF